ncbi:nuclear migration protein [Sesbania bispinosa]|nr:nuclear migration protein [Sesbania bispinosa]
MAPKLDKSVMARRISEKRKEVVKVKTEERLIQVGEKKSLEDVGESEQPKTEREGDHSLGQSAGSTKKRNRSKDVGSSNVHDIFGDEKGNENIVEGIRVSWRNGVLILHKSCYKFKAFAQLSWGVIWSYNT